MDDVSEKKVSGRHEHPKILFIQKEIVPFGVQYLSALLKQHGYDVKLLFYFDPLSNNSLMVRRSGSSNEDFRRFVLRTIEEYQPDLIAFSTFTMTFRWSVDMAAFIKSHHSIPVIFGGYHASMVPEKAILEPPIDMLGIGECENMMMNLVKAMEAGSDIRKINNLWVKEGDVIYKNPLDPLVTDLDSLPFPDKTICPRGSYDLSYSLMGSRGCPYRCTYCANNYYANMYKNWCKVRFRSIENILGEIEHVIRTYGRIRRLDFADDVIALDNKRLGDLLYAVKERFGMPYSCFLHPNLINEESIRILKDTGCYWLKIGVQCTQEDKRRKYLRRNETNKQIEAIADWAHKYDLNFSFDHIFAFPFETREDLVESVRFYNQTRPTIINYGSLVYLPKTAILDLAKEKGVLSQEDIEGIERGEHESSLTSNVTRIQGASTSDPRMHVFLARVAYLYSLISFRSKEHVERMIAEGFLDRKDPIHPVRNLMAKFIAKAKANHIFIYWAVIRAILLRPFRKAFYIR